MHTSQPSQPHTEGENIMDRYPLAWLTDSHSQLYLNRSTTHLLCAELSSTLQHQHRLVGGSFDGSENTHTVQVKRHKFVIKSR